jgi:hypothetical protein
VSKEHWRRIRPALCGLALLAAALQPAAAARPGAPPPAPAASGETARAFAQRVIDLYGPHGRWWTLPDTKAGEAARTRLATAYVEAAFTRVMDDNTALAGRKTGGVDLDYDPICQCQDGPDALKLVSVAPRGADAADLHVMGPDCKPGSNECQAFVLAIRRSPGAGWRIYDVIEAGGSVRARLERHNACLRAAATAKAADRCVAGPP